MSVSALTNSFYNYVPVTSSQYETSSNKNELSTQTQENIKATDEKQTQNQIISNSYEENNKNTLSNNSDNNKNISYFTGEEILASRPEKSSNSDKQLTEEEQKQVDKLKSRDREVKTHEQAHIAAGGSYVKGGASYDYQTGPDGKQYAVGGSVNIDTSPVADDPEATIAKAQVVIKAALAPAEPSSQDQKVASAARQMMNDARKEFNSQKNTEISSEENTENTTASIKPDAKLSAYCTNFSCLLCVKTANNAPKINPKNANTIDNILSILILKIMHPNCQF